MPSRSALPSTIKLVVGRGRGSSRSAAESPLHDTRSRKSGKSSRSRGRSRSKISRTKSRERCSYEPPRAARPDDEYNNAVYESRDDDYRRQRSMSRDRRRKEAYDPSHERRERDRSRGKSERRRRSQRSRSSGQHHNDGREYEEYDDDDDYVYQKMSNVDDKADIGGGPFNLCQGDGSFSDVEPPSRTRKTRTQHQLGDTSFPPAFDAPLEGRTWSEDQYYQPRQDHSYASIAISALQLLVLMLQLALCGIAPIDVNPMVGPFPDAFSEWGGKNSYLIQEERQYWRFITSGFLHVGVLHLLANTFCLLYSSALFEREWGSWTWLFIFVVSELGCVGVSCVADPNTIAVGSSGALMGLFAAKLAHVLTYTFFETSEISQDEGIQVDQLSSVLCGLTLVSLLSSFTYVDWSGHMGGLASGFFAGIVVFARPIKSCCLAFLWTMLGLAGLVGTATVVIYFFMYDIEPDEELADACEYFRNLFPEGYECGCFLW